MTRRKCLTSLGAILAIVSLGGTESPIPSASVLGSYSRAAISCDSPHCAEIGRKVLEENGTVADSAVATLLCMGLFQGQSMGIGGGFLMTYYKKDVGQAYTLNARERAPGLATEDMYKGNATLSATGGLAVAVPGEMKGYWELYKKFGGGVPWKRLIEPTIELCEKGFEVSSHTLEAISKNREILLATPSMKEIYVDPKTGDFYKLGEKMTRPVLAKTLRTIANDSVNGGDLLYQKDSNLAQWFVEDLRELGGIITTEDMVNYKVTWDPPINVTVNGGFTVHSVPPPGGGVILAFILRILDKYNFSSLSMKGTEADSVKVYHLIIEAFKHAYAKRTMLGDPFDPEITATINELVHNLTVSAELLDSVHKKIKPDWTSNIMGYYGGEFYQVEDHGTSHISIIGPNGDAIAVTSTVNLFFGARIRSNRTGIIYNDQMDDFCSPNITNAFGVPPSPHNFIRPGKRPLSSMSPTIITDEAGDVRLVVGTAGGTRITSTTSYVTIRNLWFNESIKEAIDARRIHHQLAPMEVEFENGFFEPHLQGLEHIGHKITMGEVGSQASSITMGVARSANGTLWANCDFRKPCSIDGY